MEWELGNKTTSKKITLKTSDGVKFKVPEAMAKESRTIHDILEDDCGKSLIFLPNVTGRTFAMVIEYCEKHESIVDLEELTDHVYMPTIFELIFAAHFLKINKLMDLSCQKMGDIKGQSPEKIRREIYFANGFTLKD
ncbi:Skp1 [Rhynchospora pubera]|uniref:SKP1-like protein n=1 Tax=Rhynchospora pubera TaxID=906938 RepID=A0AAV8DD58_9POAL|nr:Skp1 [Rhynchospora pubera]